MNEMTIQIPTRKSSVRSVWFLLAAVVTAMTVSAADDNPFTKRTPPPLVGRWDVTVRDGEQSYPSWLAFEQSGYRTLVGTYVGQFGSARPIAEVELENSTGRFHFTIPPQWERRTNPVVFTGVLAGETLRGETANDQGQTISWSARRAPALERATMPKWGTPINLLNGRDLTGWRPRHPQKPNGWRVINGALTNAVPGNDLRTEREFSDFKLHAKFRYPKGSNSGIYLRGRYEVQIEDNFGAPPDSHFIGGVYGFLTPRVNAARPAGEWQTLDITLIGRVVTVVLNGEPIIERQVIPGITGGALDSNEELSGPLLVQGDHGPIGFKELKLTPAK